MELQISCTSVLLYEFISPYSVQNVRLFSSSVLSGEYLFQWALERCLSP